MAKKDIMAEEQKAAAEVEAAARAAVKAEQDADAAKRSADNAAATTALQASHDAQVGALNTYNQTQYDNLGQILSDVQSRMDVAKVRDEAATKRENAYRYISGLGDTLSSVANLVGTAHGAANQQQTYNSHAVVQKAEEARKARKLEMDDLSKRLDEMKTRQRELKAAGSLKEAELQASLAKEKAALLKEQNAADEAAKKYYATRGDSAAQAAVSKYTSNRNYQASQEAAQTAKDQWQKQYNLQYAKFKEEQKGNKYNFTFSDGSIDIPKEKINDVNVERIFQMLPAEIRNSIKGEATTEYSTDEYGQTVRKTGYKAPTINQKLAAIGAYAESDIAIKNELRRMADMKLLEDKKTDDGEDFSAYKVASQTSQPQVTQLGLDWKSHFKDWQEPALPLRRE